MAKQSAEEIDNGVPGGGNIPAQILQTVQKALDGVFFFQIPAPCAQSGQRQGPLEHAQGVTQAFQQLFAVLAQA